MDGCKQKSGPVLVHVVVVDRTTSSIPHQPILSSHWHSATLLVRSHLMRSKCDRDLQRAAWSERNVLLRLQQKTERRPATLATTAFTVCTRSHTHTHAHICYGVKQGYSGSANSPKPKLKANTLPVAQISVSSPNENSKHWCKSGKSLTLSCHAIHAGSWCKYTKIFLFLGRNYIIPTAVPKWCNTVKNSTIFSQIQNVLAAISKGRETLKTLLQQNPPVLHWRRWLTDWSVVKWSLLSSLLQRKVSS